MKFRAFTIPHVVIVAVLGLAEVVQADLLITQAISEYQGKYHGPPSKKPPPPPPPNLARHPPSRPSDNLRGNPNKPTSSGSVKHVKPPPIVLNQRPHYKDVAKRHDFNHGKPLSCCTPTESPVSNVFFKKSRRPTRIAPFPPSFNPISPTSQPHANPISPTIRPHHVPSSLAPSATSPRDPTQHPTTVTILFTTRPTNKPSKRKPTIITLTPSTSPSVYVTITPQPTATPLIETKPPTFSPSKYPTSQPSITPAPTIIVQGSGPYSPSYFL